MKKIISNQFGKPILGFLLLFLCSCTSEYYLIDKAVKAEFDAEINNLINKKVELTMNNNNQLSGKLISFDDDSISLELEDEISVINEIYTRNIKTKDISALEYVRSNGARGAAIGFLAGGIIGFATEFVTGSVSNSGPHPDKGASFMFGGFIGTGLGVIIGNIFYSKDIFYFN